MPGGGRAGEREDAGADDGADAERGQAPRTQRLAQPLSGSSEAAISASMLFVRKSWLKSRTPLGRLSLALALALHHLLDLLLHRAARHAGGAFGLGGRLLARRALQLLAFRLYR